MSKRYIHPQEQGERKRAKLDVTISDHNFPLSQNNVGSVGDANKGDTWGDENDDEILLLASQACEEVYGDHNLSTLPDYSMCMQPPSTSTQIGDPSTSKAAFTFKKPTATAYKLSTKINDNVERISSPLPGLSYKINNSEDIHSSNSDFIFNDKICKGQDVNYIYRQLLQLQEENTKLKSENGKLSEKCVTKEGEASILRTQLKNCQTAVDNARLDKMKVQEKAQMEWSEKVATVTNQVHDLRTQLDFKNLEIISIKEKCKMLESTKVKLTQVTVAGNDITSSQRHHSSMHAPYDAATRRTKTISNSVQTDDKSHFLRLNTAYRLESSSLNRILPLLMEPTSEECPILEYNDKLRTEDSAVNKCRIFNTIHRLPSTPNTSRTRNKKKPTIEAIHNDLSSIAAGADQSIDSYFNVLKFTKEVLSDVQCELEAVLQRATTAFHKQMDLRYIEASSSYLHVSDLDLLSARPLYKDEQAILARRATAALRHVLEGPGSYEIMRTIQDNAHGSLKEIFGVTGKICQLLDDASCAVMYSGLLLSIVELLERAGDLDPEEVAVTVRRAAWSRPAPMVACALLRLVEPARRLCAGDQVGNLKTDYEQGVLLFKRDSCALQVLLRQVEAALKCMHKQGLAGPAADVTRTLVLLQGGEPGPPAPRCECQTLLDQVTVFGLRICAGELRRAPAGTCGAAGVCRAGVRLVQQRGARDMEFGARLGHAEGQLQQLCDELSHLDHDQLHGNMLSEITSTFQTSPEDSPKSFHKQAWLRSFQTFSIQD